MKIKKGKCFLLVGALFGGTIFPHAGFARDESRPKQGDRRMADFIAEFTPFALHKVLDNVVGANHILYDHEPDRRGEHGAVIAAPSIVRDVDRNETQDYTWRWKRDAAIVVRFLARVMRQGPLHDIQTSKKVNLLNAYVQFCLKEQMAHYQDGVFDLGHAKVTLGAERNPYEWGYPQNDGPPLESYALYEILMVYSELGIVNETLYRDLITAFNRNTEYILQNYREAAVERWEEHKALSHFSILAEMHGALGLVEEIHAQLSKMLPVVGKSLVFDAERIAAARADIEQLVRERHIAQDGHIRAHYETVARGSLVREKASALDVQVLMTSVFINKWWDLDRYEFYSPSHPHMRNTFHRLRQAFAEKYPINRRGIDILTGEPLRSLVFGRYPEDQAHFNGAPWFITTFAAIQYVMWDAIDIHRMRQVKITTVDLPYFQDLGLHLQAVEEKLRAQPEAAVVITAEDPLYGEILRALIRFGKESFFRIMVHTGERGDMSLTEVINANSGFKEGIENLTWSYVEALKTVRIIEQAEALDVPLSLGLSRPGRDHFWQRCYQLLRRK